MKLSPLDIKHQNFKQALNGYNKLQVQDFLEKVADLLEGRIEEVQSLRIELAERDQKIKDLEVSELELKKTGIVAERLSNEAKAQAEQGKTQAKREAELILREAESKSADIIKAAEDEKKRILLNVKSEAEAQKRRTGRIIENLKRQTEFNINNMRQKALLDLEAIHKTEIEQVKKIRQDITDLSQMRQVLVERFRAALKEYEVKLDYFTDSKIPEIKIPQTNNIAEMTTAYNEDLVNESNDNENLDTNLINSVLVDNLENDSIVGNSLDSSFNSNFTKEINEKSMPVKDIEKDNADISPNLLAEFEHKFEEKILQKIPEED